MNTQESGKTIMTDHPPNRIDWGKLKLPKLTSTRLQATEIADLDYHKIKLASKVLKKSMSSILQTAVYTYLGKNWKEHEDRLIIKAVELNMSIEELAEKLLNDEIEV